MRLNEKQKAFCDFYIESLNATESYQKAYDCSYNTARTNGARLLTNANIKNISTTLCNLRMRAG